MSTKASHIWTASKRTGLAILASATVTTLMYLGLARINLADGVADDRSPSSRLCLRIQELPDHHRPEEPTPTEPPPEPEVMTVDLDLPAPPPVTVTPIDLDLPAPRVPEYELDLSRFVVPASPPPAAARNDKKRSPAAPPRTPTEAHRVDEPPREVFCPSPRYPRSALRHGVEGVVLVKLLINTQGRVDDVVIVRVEGANSFGQAVLDVVRTWRFKPARHHGRAVKVWGTKRIRFELEDE